MNKRPVKRHLLHLLALSLVILLAGGGIALLYQWNQGTTSGFASGDNVVGPPSLPAATVDAIFQRVGSPMVGTGTAVEAAARSRNIDDAFALAVWWTETNDGAAGVGSADLNPGSVRGSTGYPSAYDGYTIYPSYTAAVNYWFMMMQRVYIDRGLTSVYTIAHPYVGTSTSDLWAGKVFALMQRYRAEAPPPTPTPAPTLAPDIKRQGGQLSQEQQQQGQGKSTYYPPVVQTPQHAPTASAQQQQQLSGNVKTLLVLFALALAVSLALWALRVYRSYAGRVQPAPAPQMVRNPWEQLRATGQPPASLFNTFSGPLRTTESLQPDFRHTETLTSTPSMWPNYNPAEVVSAQKTLIGGQLPFSNAFAGQEQVTPHASLGGQLPFPDLYAEPAQFSSGMSLGGQQPFSNVYAGAGQFVPNSSLSGQTPFPVVQTPQPQAMPTFAGRAGAQFEAQPGANWQPLRPGLAGLSRPTPGSLHRTRLQSGADTANRQPQLVGAGSGGGLLSRYREMQAQSEQE